MFDTNYIVLLGFILGLTDISAQLSLALAMDRCDITRSTIFIDSRRKELHVGVFTSRIHVCQHYLLLNPFQASWGKLNFLGQSGEEIGP